MPQQTDVRREKRVVVDASGRGLGVLVCCRDHGCWRTVHIVFSWIGGPTTPSLVPVPRRSVNASTRALLSANTNNAEVGGGLCPQAVQRVRACSAQGEVQALREYTRGEWLRCCAGGRGFVEGYEVVGRLRGTVWTCASLGVCSVTATVWRGRFSVPKETVRDMPKSEDSIEGNA
ncbi:hypothetical protein FA95DRAFT_825988 [Auriscalpium vulgare]|uniref:Uncharacterized protein n=1 Tax=Auriscalpium vulgare TaxID=40419 RepID=A0ACB8RAB5_9AGAM|nr:hypothetical protein FA95DRAFT_825988 [Auriscalpium vulgare]